MSVKAYCLITFSFLDELVYKELMKKASAAREHAYCPYSNFRVGSAVLCQDGSVFTGKFDAYLKITK